MGDAATTTTTGTTGTTTTGTTGTTGTTTGTTGTGTGTGTTTGTTTTTAAAPTWTDGVDAATGAFINERGWKGPADLVTSYRNLEKLTGVPAEQIIRLPKDMNAQTMGEVYDRLGRPKTADDYKLPVPQGGDGTFAKTAAGWMHELGLSAHQGQQFATKWNEYAAGISKAQTEAYVKSVETDKATLKAEWGAKHDVNFEMAKTAARSFGMTEAHISALERAMGYAGTHKFLANIGSKLGEAEFVTGGGKPGEFSGLTVEGAQAKITALKKDSTFVARWNSRDPMVRGEARAEMQRYEKVAYPGQVTL